MWWFMMVMKDAEWIWMELPSSIIKGGWLDILRTKCSWMGKSSKTKWEQLQQALDERRVGAESQGMMGHRKRRIQWSSHRNMDRRGPTFLKHHIWWFCRQGGLVGSNKLTPCKYWQEGKCAKGRGETVSTAMMEDDRGCVCGKNSPCERTAPSHTRSLKASTKIAPCHSRDWQIQAIICQVKPALFNTLGHQEMGVLVDLSSALFGGSRSPR